MHAVLRALPLALGSIVATAMTAAQSEQRPPLFAPLPAEPKPNPREARPRSSTAPLSGRARSLLQAAATHVLEDSAVFNAPPTTTRLAVDAASGTTIMAPVIVRGKTLEDSQVRPPTLRLYHFTPEGSDKLRRIAGGATASLYQTFIGNKELRVDLSVFNLAGKGIDHNIDFSRAEISFNFRW